MSAEQLETIKAQEDRLRFPSFDEDVAWLIGTTLVERARAEKLPVVINIRTPDATLFHAALPGSGPTNDEWARRKSNVTFRCQRASFAVGLDFKARGVCLVEQAMPVADFAPHGGSFPVRLQTGRVIAAVTVSGLPQQDDHAMVVAAITQVLEQSGQLAG